MKQKYIILLSLLHIIIMWSFAANAQFTGKITYSVDYQTFDPAMQSMIEVLPKESYLLLKENKLRFNQEIMGGGMQSFIVDKDQKSNTLMMNFMGQEYKINMTEEQVAQLEAAQKLSLEEKDDTRMIQGYECKHVVARTENDTLNIYYTNEIPTPAVLPQFSSIDGLPLYYEVNKGGIKMTYKCTSIEKIDIDESAFVVPETVREIPFNDFAKNFAISK